MLSKVKQKRNPDSIGAKSRYPTEKERSGKKVTVYNMKGEKKGTMILPDVFSQEIKLHLVHKAVLWQLKKSKVSTAHTKTRSERRGGGRKPWRQKGTGRARAGSLRSPIFRKGGVVFGPTPKKRFAIKMPKKERKLATISVLSDKALEKKIIILDKLKLTQIKTKKIEQILSKLKILGTVLLVLDKKDEKIKKSAKNIPYLKLASVSSINILDLMNFEYLLITKEGILKIAEVFGR